jgi:hypothetical protein
MELVIAFGPMYVLNRLMVRSRGGAGTAYAAECATRAFWRPCTVYETCAFCDASVLGASSPCNNAVAHKAVQALPMPPRHLRPAEPPWASSRSRQPPCTARQRAPHHHHRHHTHSPRPPPLPPQLWWAHKGAEGSSQELWQSLRCWLWIAPNSIRAVWKVSQGRQHSAPPSTLKHCQAPLRPLLWGVGCGVWRVGRELGARPARGGRSPVG